MVLKVHLTSEGSIMAIWVRESLIREGERFMDDQRVPDLEEMDEQQARQFLNELFTHLGAEKE